MVFINIRSGVKTGGEVLTICLKAVISENLSNGFIGEKGRLLAIWYRVTRWTLKLMLSCKASRAETLSTASKRRTFHDRKLHCQLEVAEKMTLLGEFRSSEHAVHRASSSQRAVDRLLDSTGYKGSLI